MLWRTRVLRSDICEEVVGIPSGSCRTRFDWPGTSRVGCLDKVGVGSKPLHQTPSLERAGYGFPAGSTPYRSRPPMTRPRPTVGREMPPAIVPKHAPPSPSWKTQPPRTAARSTRSVVASTPGYYGSRRQGSASAT